MNIIFLCQSKTLDVFFSVAKSMERVAHIGNIGFYINDSIFYNNYMKAAKGEFPANAVLLKEWEIIEKSRRVRPDIGFLSAFEDKYGDPVLWNSLVADRGIFYGKKAMVEQDYSRRYSHDRMMSILQTGIREMEVFFDRVKPTAIVGFICVTFGEYLAYLFAKSRNIPFLDLRPSRIQNYFFGGESVFEPSSRLQNTFRNILSNGISESLRSEASSFLTNVRKTNAMYEGVLPAEKSKERFIGNTNGAKRNNFLKVAKALTKFYSYHFGEFRHDNYFPGVIRPLWFNKIKKPVRTSLTDIRLKKYYIDEERIRSIEYAFFPLHREPEVTLLVYSPSYLNQIEVIRNIARSLPVGMKLVVKEHPTSVGYRRISYYKKLTAIPNVLLAPVEMSSRELVLNSRLITIISGSIGLEGLIMKKPVVHFGAVPFSFLPDSMIQRVADLSTIGTVIKHILQNYSHDEASMLAYIAAVIETSVPLDFYSVLLQRPEAYNIRGKNYSDDERRENIERLCRYIFAYFNDSQSQN